MDYKIKKRDTFFTGMKKTWNSVIQGFQIKLQNFSY
jgi:hypothetical protein